MQAIDSFVLLPRKTLPRAQMYRTFLFADQAKIKTPTVAISFTTATIVEVNDLFFTTLL